MIVRLILMGVIFALIITGLLYLLGLWRGGGDDWRDYDDEPEGPPPHGDERKLPADKSPVRELHDADADD